MGDGDVLKCLRMLTFLPLEQIDEMDRWQGSQLNTAKEILAFELTKLVHGEEEAAKAQAGARALFVGGGDTEHMPTTEVTAAQLGNGMGLLELMVLAELAASKGEARRLMQQGGVTVDDQKIADIAYTVTAEQFKDGQIIIKKGKKTFRKILLK